MAKLNSADAARRVPVRSIGIIDPDALTVDEIQQLDDADQRLLVHNKVLDLVHFREGLSKLGRHVDLAVDLIPEVRALPRRVRGVLRLPDGSPATRLSVEPATPDHVTIGRGVVTDELGVFTLPLPNGLPDATRAAIVRSGLGLLVRGDNGGRENVGPLPVPDGGREALGEIVLDGVLDPLPKSVVGALIDLVEGLDGDDEKDADTHHPDQVVVQLGEDACGIRFDEDKTVRRYPYRVLVRLVEPRATAVNQAWVPKFRRDGNREGNFLVPFRGEAIPSALGLPTQFVDRVPVERPISVEDFRDNVIGVDANGFIDASRKVPIAGTLGLGYVLNLAHTWRFDGLSLGNLLYSLPLAPGEQQRIAISEQTATAAVREDELLDVAEAQQARLRQDASTQAVFESAFHESVRANSSFENEASSSSWGVAGGIGGVLGGAIGALVGGVGAAGGGGSSSNSGSTRSALDGARQFTSHAAESMHSSVEREAAGRRRAQRVGIRMATETEREALTTKVITNHNKTRALTIQYWEVLRHFRVSSEVEGATLVCFVPLDLVRFLSPGQPRELEPDNLGSRAAVLARYGPLHEHADAIQAWLPTRHREGLKILDDFAANPLATVNLTAPATTTISFSITGSFLPFERVWVTTRLRGGGSLGPVLLDGALTDIPQSEFTNRAGLIDELKRQRSSTDVAITGTVALPQNLDPSEIVGFELTRSFRTLDYQLKVDASILELFGKFGMLGGFSVDVVDGIRLTPGELEGLLGGPMVHNFSARIAPTLDMAADPMVPSRELPPNPLPIPAVEQQPTLHYRDLLKIERTLQHVVRNTMTYSKAVWASLTPEERVVMLEGYTIGLPTDGLDPGGLTDPSQNVPLLNCIGNQVLGFYGNSMIMPFSIPAALAVSLRDDPDEEDPLTTGKVQEALTAFHCEAFSPPVSSISLPTRGVLGEAVLGHCPSAEKIDLTRFWNWQDSPNDEAPEIGPVGFRGALDAGALTGPSSLTAIPSIVNNLTAGDAAKAGDVIKALSAVGAAQQDFSTDFLGQDVLKELGGKTIDSAEKARADALAKSSDLAKQAMTSAVDVFKAKQADIKAKEEKQEQAEEKEKAETKEKEEKDKASAQSKSDAAVKNLKEHAASYLAAADSQADQAAADLLAKAVVEGLFGGPPSKVVTAALFSQYDKKDTGDARTQGSTAFLKALGLI